LISCSLTLRNTGCFSNDEFDTFDNSQDHPPPIQYVYTDDHRDLQSFAPAVPNLVPESDKRKSPPSTPAPSTTVTIKKTKLTSGGSRGRVKASDFDSITKAVLEDAISYYRTQISTVYGYPDRIQDRDWAAAAWVKACKDRGLQIEFDDDILKLVVSFIN
jgi:Domain of unknown function (DUF6532)